ncbi:MAG: hypothetical protein IKA50_01855 [Clostridia bacterium]|nr:hypothetical protein [Clostridia bacterium]
MCIKINNMVFSAEMKHTHVDYTWNNRESQAITLEADYATVVDLFVDDVAWSNADTGEDMSEYCVAGSITDNRDGTCTVKMGKLTDGEVLAIMLGGENR